MTLVQIEEKAFQCLHIQTNIWLYHLLLSICMFCFSCSASHAEVWCWSFDGGAVSKLSRQAAPCTGQDSFLTTELTSDEAQSLFLQIQEELLSIDLEISDISNCNYKTTSKCRNVTCIFPFPFPFLFLLTQSAKSWLPLLPLIAHALEL